MYRQTGPYVLEDGRLKRGVVIRHLQLPGELENTRRCIDWVAAVSYTHLDVYKRQSPR